MAQSSLFDEAPQPVETLFFALLPPDDVAQRISELARGLCRRHGLRAKPQDADRLHLSLQGLGEYAGLPPGLEARSREAAALVRAAPFHLTLDTVQGWGRRAGNGPVVLTPKESALALHELHHAIGQAMARVGLGRQAGAGFSPHVTLLYADALLPPEPAEPVAWTVEEFVLVHSLVGQHRHTHLGRWRLIA